MFCPFDTAQSSFSYIHHLVSCCTKYDTVRMMKNNWRYWLESFVLFLSVILFSGSSSSGKFSLQNVHLGRLKCHFFYILLVSNLHIKGLEFAGNIIHWCAKKHVTAVKAMLTFWKCSNLYLGSLAEHWLSCSGTGNLNYQTLNEAW